MCMSSAAADAAAIPQQAPQASLQFLAYLQGLETSFAVNANAILFSVETFAVQVGKDAVVFLIILGVLLYFTRLSRRLGREFMEGGAVIAVFIWFGLPYLVAAYC